MGRFEYKIVEGKLSPDGLNNLGREGWELVSAVPVKGWTRERGFRGQSPQ